MCIRDRFITVLSFILIMTVYSRFFKLYIYTALAPVPIAAFGSSETAATGKAFLKGYVGVCLEEMCIRDRPSAARLHRQIRPGDQIYGGPP